MTTEIPFRPKSDDWWNDELMTLMGGVNDRRSGGVRRMLEDAVDGLPPSVSEMEIVWALQSVLMSVVMTKLVIGQPGRKDLAEEAVEALHRMNLSVLEMYDAMNLSMMKAKGQG